MRSAECWRMDYFGMFNIDTVMMKMDVVEDISVEAEEC
jgi:hypothetical protein